MVENREKPPVALIKPSSTAKPPVALTKPPVATKQPVAAYAVGVGAGKAEWLTIEAIQTIEKCSVIICPQTKRGNSVAYEILEKSGVDVSAKTVVKALFPMTHDKEALDKNYSEIALQCITYLEKGENVALLTIGDVALYSTAYQVARRIENRGYCVEYVSGISSLSVASALAKTALVEGNEPLHIIPTDAAIKEGSLKASLSLDGTKVLMKLGRSYEVALKMIYEMHLEEKSILVQNCGIEGERVLFLKEYEAENKELYKSETYFSIIIIKQVL